MNKSLLTLTLLLPIPGMCALPAECPILDRAALSGHLGCGTIPESPGIFDFKKTTTPQAADFCTGLYKQFSGLVKEEKKYSGKPSNLKDGTMVCHYPFKLEAKSFTFKLSRPFSWKESKQEDFICPVLSKKDIEEVPAVSPSYVDPRGKYWQAISDPATLNYFTLWFENPTYRNAKVGGRMDPKETVPLKMDCTYTHSGNKELVLNGTLNFEKAVL